MPTHYEVLGVDEKASPRAIRAAYLELMRQVHPDRDPAGRAQGQRISAADLTIAYSTLKDQFKRASYDAHLARGRYPATGLMRLEPPRRRFRTRAAVLYLLWLVGFALLISHSLEKRAQRNPATTDQAEAGSPSALVRNDPESTPAPSQP